MASNVTFNSVTYSVPAETDESWGPSLSSYLIAIASGSLQKSGGTFTLTAEASFGATYGLKSAYYKSLATNPSSAGILRLGNAEVIGWRNAANSADLSLTVNSSNQLTFNSVVLASTTGPSFQDSLFTIFDNGDITKILAFDCASITTGTTRTLTIPDASGNIVLPATTDTFTNKTFDAEGTGNALSNITNTHIKAAAAIALDKLAALTVSRLLVSDGSGFVSVSSVTSTEAGYLSGVTSAIQTQLNAKAPAASPTFSGTITTQLTASRALTTGASSELAASATTATELGYVSGVTSAIQTQIDGKVTAASPEITDPLLMAEESSTPATPASGKFKIYPKNDGKFYTLNDAGLETEVGAGGGSSGINYIDNPDAETDTTGYAAYADAAATSPVDGTGGSPTLTITRSTSSPLRGVGSFLITKDAADRQGEGVSYDFTIDTADQGKVLQGYFDYAIGSGTYADDDMSVWIYDVTNARLIQPAPYLLKNHSLPSERMPFEFQTAIDSTSYRLIIHQASTSASAYTIKFDNVSVGPQAKLYGSAVTDPVAYTPTITGFGAVSGVNFKSWKDGKFLFFEGVFTSGTSTAVEAQVTLGFCGANANVSTVSTLPTTSVAGQWARGTSATTNVPILLQEPSKTYVTFATQTASFTGLTKRNGNDIVGAGDIVSINGKVEIQGWSSSQIMSQDASTRVVAMRVNAATPTGPLNTASAVIFGSAPVFDTHGSYNLSTGQYTVKVPGYYKVKASLSITGTEATNNFIDTYIYKNTTAEFMSRNRIQNTSTDDNSAVVDGTVYCTAGDTLEVRVSTNIGSAGFNTNSTLQFFEVSMLQGPAQVLSSESVTASYRISSDKTPSASNPIDFDTKIFDSHNAVTTGSSWKFTAPMSGTYQVSNTNATSTTGGTLDLYTNGSQDRGLFSMPDISVRSATAVVKLLTGQYVDVRCDTASKTFSGTKNNTIYITRIGNY